MGGDKQTTQTTVRVPATNSAPRSPDDTATSIEPCLEPALLGPPNAPPSVAAGTRPPVAPPSVAASKRARPAPAECCDLVRASVGDELS